MSTKSPKAPLKLLCLQHRQSSTNYKHHLTQLSPLDRKYLIAGLVGEYEYLCHDDAQDGDMTPAEHYAKLITYSDAELLDDSDLIESPYLDAQDFYEYHSSYCPSEYWV